MSTFKEILKEQDLKHKKKCSDLMIKTDFSTNGDSGMKDTIIRQLDIFDHTAQKLSKVKPLQEDHKFKGPKARFKGNTTSSKRKEPVKQTTFTPIRKPRFLDETTTIQRSHSSLSCRDYLRESREQLEKKVDIAFQKMAEMKEVYERRRIEKEEIILKGAISRSNSKIKYHNRVLLGSD